VRVFLTGGTGFIGSAVARRLRARGDEVRALVRNPDKAKVLTSIGCEATPGDLGDEASIRGGMRGCDAVIHGAAIYEIGIKRARRPAMLDANVRGTERVLGAALELGIPKVVYVSTVAAFGNTRGVIVDETFRHPGDSYTSYYEETKVAAHAVAREMIAKGLPCVIAQPGLVYGPGDQSETGRTMARFLSGKLPALPFQDTGVNAVHVDDVAEGIVLALDKGRPGESYVFGGEVTTLGGLIGTLARVAGKKPPRKLPGAFVKMAIPFGPVIGPLMGFPSNMRELVRSSDGVTFWARHDKAMRELGYAPRSLEQGLRDTLAAS
jgi:nucleoside-diphosphate-sugar epimerase